MTGQGNSRFNWVDTSGNLWLGHVDLSTGAFTPTSGQSELADTTAAFWTDFNNGPEWAFSQQGSQLVYSRYNPGSPRTPEYAGAAMATMKDGVWTAGFLPGGYGSVNPIASQWLTDPYAKVSFWPVATAPIPQQAIKRMSYEVVTLGVDVGISYQQIFWYDTATAAYKQLTTDPTSKSDGFMFQAPEFNYTWTFFDVSGDETLNIYELSGYDSNGAPDFTLVKSITSPLASEPYILSPEPFINISPTTPLLNVLTTGMPVRKCSDPEYYININLGPPTGPGGSTE